MKTKYLAINLIFFIFFNHYLRAQIESDIRPHSIDISFVNEDVREITMQAVDMQKLFDEDEIDKEQGLPWRFGKAIATDITMLNSGTWTNLKTGGRIWRLKIYSPKARSINLIYNHFYLPAGATFHIYNEQRSSTIGAFTSKNNKINGKFATGIIRGEKCILEYFEPEQQEGNGLINIIKVIHGYKDVFNKAAKTFDASGNCNNNINCPEGSNWQDEKRAVAMILTHDNSRICTGALVNNVQQNEVPYFLTANHCFYSTSDTENWIFMFNYESPNCSDVDGPINQTISGCTVRARNPDSDFLLLELSSPVPESYNAYYAGWSRINTNATNSTAIHHPRGDIKKISFDNNASSSTDYIPYPYLSNSHWQVANWEDGTTELGSSGSPLFDQNSRITGQLHGGFASCSSNTADYYGKFSMSWDRGTSANTRLRDWLNPTNTSPLILDGYECTNILVANQTILSNTIINACSNVTITNVSVVNNSKLTVDAANNCEINGSFEVTAGSQLEIN